MSGPSVDPSTCPLCGKPNECALARGARSCWCFDEAIPAEVLARVPPEAQGVACVCRACARGEGTGDRGRVGGTAEAR
jgi:hypothetical protein